MPVIRLDFDNDVVTDEQVKALSEVTRKIMIELSGIEDVFVYANSSQIKIAVAPIELFIEMSAHKIANLDQLVSDLRSRLSEWKVTTGFPHKINFSFIPMNWRIEI